LISTLINAPKKIGVEGKERAQIGITNWGSESSRDHLSPQRRRPKLQIEAYSIFNAAGIRRTP